MNTELNRLPDDDEPLVMTAEERSVWVYLVGSVVAAAVYAGVVIPRALTQPIEDVSWIVPMLWAIGASVVFTIVGTIVSAIGSAVRLAARGRNPEFELESDVRDKEISSLGNRASATVVGFGIAGALIVTMLGLDHFWIGNLLYAAGFSGALAETITKIRLYRRGF